MTGNFIATKAAPGIRSGAIADAVRWLFLGLCRFHGLRFASFDGASQFIGERIGMIDLPQGLDNGARVGRNRAADHIVVNKVPRQRLDIAVENDANDLSILINERTS